MKQLIKLTLLILLISSCSEDNGTTEAVEPIDTSSIKKLDMNTVGNNYDQLVLDIQSNQNLDFVIGDFNLEMRNMRPAEGITVENTIILEDERDNKTIIIDHNTQSIYVRVTDIDTKRNIVMYGFKDSNHLERLVKQDEYNIEFLTNRASYVNRSNKVAQLDYVATQTSFLISKPILTTKEELSQARINDGNTIECGVQEDDRSNRTTERASSTNRRKTWNLVIYKQNSQMSTSSEIDAVKSTFRSLSSTEGSNWYYSTIMYAELNIRYEQAPSTFHNTNSNQCLTDFTFHLLTLGVPHNRYDHSYVYLKEEKWDDAAGRAANVSYRIAVSRNSRGTLAHEVGHTLGAVHNSSTFWDSSLGWFGWWGSSIMCEAYPWWSGMQYKYYSASNRGIVKGTLN